MSFPQGEYFAAPIVVRLCGMVCEDVANTDILKPRAAFIRLPVLRLR